jgi:hypothetical protein
LQEVKEYHTILWLLMLYLAMLHLHILQDHSRWVRAIWTDHGEQKWPTLYMLFRLWSYGLWKYAVWWTVIDILKAFAATNLGILLSEFGGKIMTNHSWCSWYWNFLLYTSNHLTTIRCHSPEGHHEHLKCHTLHTEMLCELICIFTIFPNVVWIFGALLTLPIPLQLPFFIGK